MNIEQFIEKARAVGFLEIQITEIKVKEETIELINCEVEKNQIDMTTSYLIKASTPDTTVNASTEYLDASILDLLLEKSQYIENKNRELLPECQISKTIINELVDYPSFAPVLQNIQKEIAKQLKRPYISSIRTHINRYQKITHIINTSNTDLISKNEFVSSYIEAITQKGEEMVNQNYQEIKKTVDEFSFAQIYQQVVDQALFHLEKEAIENKKYDIILTPKVFSYILSSMIPMLDGKKVKQHQSLLEGKKNTKIATTCFSLCEYPQQSQYPSYSPFDEEATVTTDKKIIDEGVLKLYLYNQKTALECDTISTGNGYQNQISVRNYLNKPGTRSHEELEKLLKNGLVFEDLMTSEIDPNTGDMSLQVFGYQIKDGQKYKSVKPCIITTNLLELLNSLVEVGNNLTFVNSKMASTSVLVKNISVVNEQ